MSVLKSRDAGEGDDSSGGENAFGKFWRAGEAVEDGADVVGVVGVDFEGIVEAGGAGFISGVDDDIEARGLGDLEMSAEEVALAGVVSFGGPAFWSGVEVVETGFADGDDFGIGEVGSEEGFEVVAALVNVAGVNTDADGNLGMVVGDLEVEGEIILAGGEGDHAVDAIFLGARDEVWELFSKTSF